MAEAKSRRYHYFESRISRGFVSLYTGRTVMTIASGLVGVFLPIFLYQLFDQSFTKVALFFLVSSLVYVVLLLFSASKLNKIGFRRALQISVLLGASFYGLFYFVTPENYARLIPIALALLVGFRFLFWIPYHVDFIKFTDRKDRGKEVSLLIATKDILVAGMPLVAGFIASYFGFDILFGLTFVVWLLAGVSFMTLPRTKEKFRWSPRETTRQLFSKERRSVVLSFFAQGIETAIGVAVWPVFIFVILNGNLFEVGLYSTLVILFSGLLQLLVGKKIDGSSIASRRTMKVGSLFYALGWIFKIFVATALHIFVIGVFHNIARIFTNTPFETEIYNLAADQGHYVDEFTVLYEIALNLGRILALGIFIVMALFIPIQWTFIIGAIASLALNLIWLGQSRTALRPRI